VVYEANIAFVTNTQAQSLTTAHYDYQLCDLLIYLNFQICIGGIVKVAIELTNYI